MLDFLNGISPWWWLALALALGALEMATFSLFLIWPAVSALIMAVLLALVPDMSPASQISIFATVAILSTIVGRFLFLRYGDGGGTDNQDLNNRGARFIGRDAKVLEFSNGHGVVEIEGMRWRAQWNPNEVSAVDEQVRITHANGLLLSVEPIAS
ncbi:hypothetical protein GCM10007939_23690 [Amylibacter marinus]|uniref:NfeD-like C-terminal domain-containing protein n=1 Tax=Amylibacter marinus TaxID=1475483 RepID=A0ABQ5VXT8_9RHOB|nr:NfeD family protein [Amylibacter marinus]GLQ36085.1 hypothetical protein GCM10007939_23690 [Amylibacter marinus]